MSVVITNLAAGPGTLYTAAFGAAEPLDTAVATAPSAPWVDAGGTNGGAKLKIDQKYFELKVDQIVDRAGSRLTNRACSVETMLAEVTLVNLLLALNGGTNSSGGTGATAWNSYDPDESNSASQLVYNAVMLDAWGPSGKRRRIILRKVINIKTVDADYKVDGQALFGVEFACHWVSSSIKPFHIVDDASP